MDEYQQILEILSRSGRVLLTTHVRPDGDALGSCAAMALGLATKGIASEVLLLSQLPRKYAFIFRDHGVVHHEAEAGIPPDFDFGRFEALVAVDTGTWSQLPHLRQHIEHWSAPKIVIDHHLTQENWADIKLVRTEASAAGEIVADLLKRWAVPFDQSIASALFLAVASDTGWFQFSSTRPATLRLAADLMECGVDTDRMYQALYQNERKQRLDLQTRAQESMQLLLDGRLAIMALSNKDFQEVHAHVGDTENLINVPLQLASVEASVLIIEPPEGRPIRVSLRSKGRIDMARFAEGFGGGGHARAAGLKLDTDFQEARLQIIAALTRQMADLFTEVAPDAD